MLRIGEPRVCLALVACCVAWLASCDAAAFTLPGVPVSELRSTSIYAAGPAPAPASGRRPASAQAWPLSATATLVLLAAAAARSRVGQPTQGRRSSKPRVTLLATSLYQPALFHSKEIHTASPRALPVIPTPQATAAALGISEAQPAPILVAAAAEVAAFAGATLAGAAQANDPRARRQGRQQGAGAERRERRRVGARLQAQQNVYEPRTLSFDASKVPQKIQCGLRLNVQQRGLRRNREPRSVECVHHGRGMLANFAASQLGTNTRPLSSGSSCIHRPLL